MDITYLILAHQNPAQLRRLVYRLLDQDVHIYIHIDRNTDIAPFQQALAGLDKQVSLVGEHQRHHGSWGGLGIVRGTLAGMQQAQADGRTGTLILLSGMDYPIKSRADIRRFFQEHAGQAFMHGRSIREPFTPEHPRRLRNYAFFLCAGKGDYLLLPPVCSAECLRFLTSKRFWSIRFFKRLIRLIRQEKCRFLKPLFRKRNFPDYLEPHFGSQWWALPMAAVERVLAFIKVHPDYEQYHHFTLLPDECFFHSIVFSQAANWGIPLHSTPLTYTRWEAVQPTSPLLLTETDYPDLIRSSCLFARKFDPEKSKNLLDRLDALESR